MDKRKTGSNRPGQEPNCCYICGAEPVARMASTVFHDLVVGLCASHAGCKVACTALFPPQFIFVDEEGREVPAYIGKYCTFRPTETDDSVLQGTAIGPDKFQLTDGSIIKGNFVAVVKIVW